MEAKEEIYQYIKENRKEGVTAQDIAEIFGIKRRIAMNHDDKNDLIVSLSMWAIYWLIVIVVLKGLGL